MRVSVGIDSHKSSLAVAAVDELGRVVGGREFANDPQGHKGVHAFVKSLGDERVIGVEGAGIYGFALGQFLLAHGEVVKEVPAFLTHRERKHSPAKGKSDVGDAIAIARTVGRGEGLAEIASEGIVLDLRLLSERRDQLVRDRTQVANQLHGDLATLAAGYESRIPNLKAKRHLDKVAVLLRGDHRVRADIARDRVRALRAIDRDIAAIEKKLAAKVIESGTSLAQMKGIRFILAAKIIGQAGDVGRFRSKGGFAMYAGTAPLEASSGTVKRHRLNRGGNRQLNNAIHMMAIARIRYDTESNAYIARKKSDGKTHREALRSLKRQLSNVIYRALMADAQLGQMAT